MIKFEYPDFWQKKMPISYILYPLSYVYRLLGFIRKFCTKQKKFSAPVICVGNVTVGGTGKTPLIIALASHYIKQKKNLVIICKGYGGSFIKPTIIEANFSTCLAGDEAIEIAKEFSKSSNVTIIITKNPKDCISILSQIKPDLILIDDGLQNPSFFKDFSILVIDGLRGLGNGFLIPSGPMRENYKPALKYADIVVSSNPSKNVKEELNRLACNKFYHIKQYLEVNVDKNEPIFLLCAIGNPEKFFVSMKNYNIVGKISFPDHHKYSTQDLDIILKKASKAGATKIVTTNKDYVKLYNLKSSIEIKTARIFFDEKDIKKIIKKIDEKIS